MLIISLWSLTGELIKEGDMEDRTIEEDTADCLRRKP